ncbi:hypothetical protein CVIRNUC_001174 [Coccomyxa viridis]|uniref:mannan endo-1,4-beta-mannosidase n=1 Tax=Coccomyxa viridis TaxID=1274662 RepID=A0AAV1HTA5_9CHLO|nr:hypothetical protein CVIRNUC_001174 [Coccomyxa viridis]
MVECAAGAPQLGGATLPQGMTGPQLLRQQMDVAIHHGLTVMRFWVPGVSPQFATQLSPGVYSEAMLEGLDYLLNEARKRNLKVIAVLLDNWKATGGVDEYVAWTNRASAKHADFFTDAEMKNWYKAYLGHITQRTNTINGLLYNNDSTILAWELLNEPRCQVAQGCLPGTVAAWVNEMAEHMKDLDPNHLLTLGEEGFYSLYKDGISANPGVPGSNWAAEEGQDFIADHNSSNVDFATIHCWPDNWKVLDSEFQRTWIRMHAEHAKDVLHKPLLFEEFGKWLNASVGATMVQRDEIFATIFDESEQIMNQPDSALKGLGFWELVADGQEAPYIEGGGKGLYGIDPTNDTTFALVCENVDFLNQKSGQSLSSCQSKPGPTYNSTCSSTEVNGLDGTGYEGPHCDIDINECVRKTDNCGANSTCSNLPGSFTCTCWRGFSGDGHTCQETPAVEDLVNQYSLTAMEGPLLCDVLYPTNAPGYVDDPTGSVARSAAKQGGTANRAPVLSLTQCLIACESAPGCSVATYSPGDQNCFLKGCPSQYAVTCPVAPNLNGQGDGLGPSAAPAPPIPPCTKVPWLCPTVHNPYYNYFSNLRYDAQCTLAKSNPGIALAPAPNSQFIITNLRPTTVPDMSTLSSPKPSSPGTVSAFSSKD